MELSDQEQKRCIVCSELRTNGIRVLGQFICVDCEREIVETNVDDEKYPYYVARMRTIWLEATS